MQPQAYQTAAKEVFDSSELIKIYKNDDDENLNVYC